jgi:hypothetical protein
MVNDNSERITMKYLKATYCMRSITIKLDWSMMRNEKYFGVRCGESFRIVSDLLDRKGANYSQRCSHLRHKLSLFAVMRFLFVSD